MGGGPEPRSGLLGIKIGAMLMPSRVGSERHSNNAVAITASPASVTELQVRTRPTVRCSLPTMSLIRYRTLHVRILSLYFSHHLVLQPSEAVGSWVVRTHVRWPCP